MKIKLILNPLRKSSTMNKIMTYLQLSPLLRSFEALKGIIASDKSLFQLVVSAHLRGVGVNINTT